MKRLLPALVLGVGLLGMTAAAQACDLDRCTFSSGGYPVHFTQRYDVDDVRFSIMNNSRKVVLLLTDNVMAMQLSDRMMHRLDRKFRDKEDEDSGPIGNVIKTAVLTSVRTVLSHCAEVDIRDIESADYRDGELVIRARNGRRIFGHTDVDDENVMRDFAPDDAKAFVRELRHRMALVH